MSEYLNPRHSFGLSETLINDLLPERSTTVGEFSPAFDAYKNVTLADLGPVSNYEFILALQLVDLNWAILQRKVSADIELSLGAERVVRSELLKKLNFKGDSEYDRQLSKFEKNGGSEDNFDDPVD